MMKINLKKKNLWEKVVGSSFVEEVIKPLKWPMIIALTLATLYKGGGYVMNKIQESQSSINYFDATGDGVEDIVAYDGKNKQYFALIGQKDGRFKKAKIKIQDGCPFYFTEDGYYDPWGNFFPRAGFIRSKNWPR
ncbi:MAG: hypothetical protein IB618_01785 [Candidatus Pacearchaeota archaeon]|nr:MAG: hypothetical protein IB618_01785 [Candidatus Pacearchaeota archaeon]